MSKFATGQKVTKKVNSNGWEDVYVVLFTKKIAGKKFCAVLGPERHDLSSEDLLEQFISSGEKGLAYHVMLIPQKELRVYREPVYVQMTRGQYDRVITVMANGPELPEDHTTIDLRDLEII